MSRVRSSDPVSTTEPAGAAALTGRQRLMLVAVMSGTFLSMLNDFIVNVATPAIRTDLGATASDLQLIIGGYVLVYGLLLVLAGRLGDLYGHRRLFLAGPDCQPGAVPGLADLGPGADRLARDAAHPDSGNETLSPIIKIMKDPG